MGAKHILVVEDEEAIRETLRFNLLREDYRLDRIVSDADVAPDGVALIGRL